MKTLSIALLVMLIVLTGCAGPLPAATQEIQATTAPQATQPPVVATAAPTETAAPTLAPTPTEAPPQVPLWIVYTGRDGNLYLLDHRSGESKPITSDAAALGNTQGNAYQYLNAQISSDGQLVAFRREVGIPVASGYDVTFELWVYDTTTGESRRMSDDLPTVGLAWKPLTHLLAYGLQTGQEYFALRGQVDSTRAKGIWAIDVDSGESMELVAPHNGFSLVWPVWSRDGRYLAFDEVVGYEGRGNFAYYDFEAQEYVHIDKALGIYDWSPDSMTLVYDYLIYTPTGEERIYLRPRLADAETPLSPDYEAGYAFWPRLSPQGDQVAYFAELNDTNEDLYTLFVVPVAGGEPRSLGEFEQAIHLSWLPDGSGLVLGAGSFEARQVVEISLQDGAVKVLADGDAPALAIPLP